MYYHSRLLRLEKKLIEDQQIWAVFSINYYENEQDKSKAQERVLAKYLSAGKLRPTACVFINEVPYPSEFSEEKYICVFKNF